MSRIVTGVTTSESRDTTKTTLTVGDQVYVGEENIKQLSGWERAFDLLGEEPKQLDVLKSTTENITLEFFKNWGGNE